MDNAPQKFWTKILTMAGLKTRNNMTGELKDKQGKVATTDEEAAEIHAEYAESAFKPLEEEEFDQENIAAIETKYAEMMQIIGNLDRAQPSGHLIKPTKNKDKTEETPAPFQNRELHTSYLRHNVRKTDVLEPTPTKHQLKEWPTAKQPTIRMYAKVKRPIPSVPGVNVAVDNTYLDYNNHPTLGDKLLLQNTIAPITIAEFNASVKKTRRKAPGINGLMVDSFKDLGKNGKTILISLCI